MDEYLFLRMLKDPERDITLISDDRLQQLQAYVLEVIVDMEYVIDELPTVDHPSHVEFVIADNDLENVKFNLEGVKKVLRKIEAEIHKRNREDDDDTPMKKSKSNTSHEQTAGGLRGKRKSRRILKGLKNKKFRKTCRKSTCKSR